MRLRASLYLFVIITIALVLITGLCLYWSWRNVEAALVQESYAHQVEKRATSLEASLHKLASHGDEQITADWLNQQWELSKILRAAPKLEPSRQLLLNSIVAHNASIRVMFERYSQLDVEAEKNTIRIHLSEMLSVKMEAMIEDSLQLASAARRDIKQTLPRQFLIIAAILLLGIVGMASYAHHLASWIRKTLFKMEHAFAEVANGKLNTVALPRSDDEFGDCANKFRLMNTQLQKTTISRDHLQKIVDDKTAVLEQLANTDTLTSVSSRRALFNRGQMEYSRARRHQHSLALLMIDVDHFKQINDKYGHQLGDFVLVYLCRTLESEVRDIDDVGRYGGEEFVLTLPHATMEGARDLGFRIQQRLLNEPFEQRGVKINLTVSQGLAVMTQAHQSFDDVLYDADRALLLAKQAGRDRLMILP